MVDLKLYPVKFMSLYKDKIWGGNKMSTVLGMEYDPLPNCGEAWLLSGVKDNETIVENGFLAENDLQELLEIYMDDLVGEKVYDKFGNEFPILIKVIDADDFLSIQVHPDDKMAKARHDSLGKTEMWYVMEAEERAEIITGFSQEITKEEYRERLANNSIKDVLNVEKPAPGDVFYTPAGRVHAIGPGVMLAEIQQSSDITYRIYDWDRRDEKGNGRELHTDLAVDAIDYKVYDEYKTKYDADINQTNSIVKNEYFTTNFIHLTEALKKNYEELDSFVIHLCVEGSYTLHWDGGSVNLKMGEAVLIPAISKEISMHPDKECKILEVYMEIN
jgi:mannose-6-phosphate isomerase